jgi:hypothetical protein
MITIVKISYTNEDGELVDINFSETDIEYRADRIGDLVREMLAGGRKLGPPPRRNDPEGSGQQAAWG